MLDSVDCTGNIQYIIPSILSYNKNYCFEYLINNIELEPTQPFFSTVLRDVLEIN
jgi:hypothetical protein